jgi:hypothetical protein
MTSLYFEIGRYRPMSLDAVHIRLVFRIILVNVSDCIPIDLFLMVRCKLSEHNPSPSDAFRISNRRGGGFKTLVGEGGAD